MRRVSVNAKALAAYLFVLILVYLAGTYVAHFYFYLYIFMIVLPLYSIVQVVLSAATLECIQAVDAESPVKGDLVRYRVWVTGKPFLTTEVCLHFAPVHSRLHYRISDMRVALTGSRFVEESFDIRLTHRGVYSIGIESMQITDALGWIVLTKPGSYRTFHVHPRILPLVPPTAETRVHAQSESGINGVEQDLTLFEGLADYREGEPVKHIAWKKYLSTGSPYLKRFGGSSEPAVIIYLDLRLPSGFSQENETVVTAEDCSIEMAISLVKGYLERGIRVAVRAFGTELHSFNGSGPADFRRFFLETDELFFTANAPSPVRLFEADRSEFPIEGSVLFVTHLVDENTFEAASERGRSGERTAIFFNSTLSNDAERDRAVSFGQMVRSTGAGSFHSARAESLKEDLQEWQFSQR